MIWYEKTYDVKGYNVLLVGLYDKSVVSVTASFPGNIEKILYYKIITSRQYDICVEDIFDKYEGIIKKCELKLDSIADEINFKNKHNI